MPAKRKKPSPISGSPKKRATKNKRARAKNNVLFSAQNIPILGFTALFCAGIMLGAFGLNRAYTMHIESIELAESERWAAERATQAAIRQARDTEIHNQRARVQAQKKQQQLAQQQKLMQRRANQKQADQRSSKNLTPSINTSTTTSTRNQSAALIPFKKVHFSDYTPAPSSNIMAIIIDDVGYKRQEGQRTLNLPGKLTVAILPFTPYAQTLAKQAPSQNKEVMLHAPMEPKKLSYWGEGLKAVMTEVELRNNFIAMINDIPNLIGVNNHMGSGLTENAQIMEWLMAELPSRGLYFIDSRTSAKSAAYNAAQKFGIPTYKRDIFLDNNRDIKDINRQLDRLISATQKTGMALGIGHPYPETLTVLEQRLPELKKIGIELVTVSELLNARSRRAELASQTRQQNSGLN